MNTSRNWTPVPASSSVSCPTGRRTGTASQPDRRSRYPAISKTVMTTMTRYPCAVVPAMLMLVPSVPNPNQGRNSETSTTRLAPPTV